MFGITGFKLIIILLAGLILIGPDKLPEIARTLGKFIRMFNEAREQMEKTISADMFSAKDEEPGPKPEPLAASLYQPTGVDNEDEEEEEE